MGLEQFVNVMFYLTIFLDDLFRLSNRQENIH